MAAPNLAQKGGFDCEFVDRPPVKFIQSECPVCLQVLREPYQAPCCGKSFCRVCIERIKTDNKPCPTCKEENFVTFHNKGLQCTLYEFQVYCSHKQEGCEWKGELGQLDNHVEVCKYSEIIDCDFHHFGCNVKLPRKDMPAHLNENLVTHMSLQAASYSKLLASHKELQANYNTLKANHTQLHVKFNAQDRKFEGRLKRLENENKQLAQRSEAQEVKIVDIVETQKKLRSHAGIVPCEHVMHKFENHKETKDRWYSPSFYTHPEGYKFCLGVDANGDGDGDGTHVSLFLFMMKGEFDDKLTWPFKGKVTLELVDQTGANQHYKMNLVIDKDVPEDYVSRVFEDRNDKGWGFPEYIAHSELKPKYCQENQVHFKITEVVLE